jgi:hypothetical protein
VRYRVVSAIGEGITENYQLQVTLDQGLTFLNDGTIKIAIVSNGGVETTITLNADGTIEVDGDRSSAIAQPIAADLSGQRPPPRSRPASSSTTRRLASSPSTWATSPTPMATTTSKAS